MLQQSSQQAAAGVQHGCGPSSSGCSCGCRPWLAARAARLAGSVAGINSSAWKLGRAGHCRRGGACCCRCRLSSCCCCGIQKLQEQGAVASCRGAAAGAATAAFRRHWPHRCAALQQRYRHVSIELPHRHHQRCAVLVVSHMNAGCLHGGYVCCRQFAQQEVGRGARCQQSAHHLGPLCQYRRGLWGWTCTAGYELLE